MTHTPPSGSGRMSSQQCVRYPPPMQRSRVVQNSQPGRVPMGPAPHPIRKSHRHWMCTSIRARNQELVCTLTSTLFEISEEDEGRGTTFVRWPAGFPFRKDRYLLCHPPSIPNHQPPIPDPQPSTLNPQHSTINPQPSTLNAQPSTPHPGLQFSWVRVIARVVIRTERDRDPVGS